MNDPRDLPQAPAASEAGGDAGSSSLCVKLARSLRAAGRLFATEDVLLLIGGILLLALLAALGVALHVVAGLP